MSVLTVVTHPDPILRQKCVEITTFGPELKRLSDNMFKTMKAYDGIGLAAPQVGILDRVLVVNFEDRKLVLVNPVITQSSGVQTNKEGCLSLPDLYLIVDRADKITVSAKDVNGDTIELTESGFFSCIIQHEMDHLDGILIIDKGTPDTEDED